MIRLSAGKFRTIRILSAVGLIAIVLLGTTSTPGPKEAGGGSGTFSVTGSWKSAPQPIQQHCSRTARCWLVQSGAEQDARIAVVQSCRSVSQEPTIMETILIVEDDQSTQKALKHLFESEGYAVKITGDGKSALEAFRSAAPTAIILDLRLPVVSGKDVCREIRQQSSTSVTCWPETK